MARKHSRLSPGMTFTCLTLAGLILLLAPAGLTGNIQFAFARAFRYPLSMGRNVPLSVPTRLSARTEENRKEAQYQNYIANLEAELQRKQETIDQLSGIRTRQRGLSGAKLVMADIITGNRTGKQSELVINRGQSDGLVRGQFVLGDNSIVGAVEEVSGRTATVKLITDAASSMPVRIKGLEIDMLMQGASGNTARIKLVPARHKVVAGDTVLAKARPGLLDTPMIAGVVAQCRHDADNPTLWDISVKPACEIDKLGSVAVIVMNPATADDK